MQQKRKDVGEENVHQRLPRYVLWAEGQKKGVMELEEIVRKVVHPETEKLVKKILSNFFQVEIYNLEKKRYYQANIFLWYNARKFAESGCFPATKAPWGYPCNGLGDTGAY